MVHSMVWCQHFTKTRWKSRKTSVSPGTRIGTGTSLINKYVTATFCLPSFSLFCKYVHYTVANGRITGEYWSERVWKEVVVANSTYFSDIWLEGRWKISVRTGEVPLEISTEHLPGLALLNRHERVERTTLVTHGHHNSWLMNYE
jgi:hypothetical protein